MRVFRFLLLATPIAAQFGIGKNKKAGGGTAFEQLNEMMKEKGDGAGGGDPMEQLRAMMGGGDMANIMENMGEDMEKYMAELSKMKPEEIQEQMKQAMEMMTSGDVMDNVIQNKEEVLANLEATGLVSAEELAKYKSDPAYFEEQMRGAFGQMKDLFGDPDLFGKLGESMESFQEAFNNPVLKEMQELLLQEEEPTDLQIEEMRLKMIKAGKDSDGKNDILGSMFGLDDLQEAMKDEKLWKESMLEGRKAVKELASMAGGSDLLKAAGGMGAGAGVGEL